MTPTYDKGKILIVVSVIMLVFSIISAIPRYILFNNYCIDRIWTAAASDNIEEARFSLDAAVEMMQSVNLDKSYGDNLLFYNKIVKARDFAASIRPKTTEESRDSAMKLRHMLLSRQSTGGEVELDSPRLISLYPSERNFLFAITVELSVFMYCIVGLAGRKIIFSNKCDAP